jgi:hypothetical protein
MLHLVTTLNGTAVLSQKVTGYSNLKMLELNSERRVERENKDYPPASP